MRFSHPLVVELPTDDPLGGKTGAGAFHVLAIGKSDSENFPFTVANEKISSELGRAIGLPLPEVLLYRLGEKWMMFSRFISSRTTGEVGPPGTAQDVARFFSVRPGLLEGMVCFDLFVCNNDRKEDNLLSDENGHVWLIDHGNALFYRPRAKQGIQAGIPRLKAVEADLGQLFDLPHAYLENCRAWEAIDHWCGRIANIPRYFIEATVNALPDEVIRAEQRDFLVEFLERRKGQLPEIIEQHPHLFPGLPPRRHT